MHFLIIFAECVTLLGFLHHTFGKTKNGGFQGNSIGIFSPLPEFNTELMTRDQCELQFTAHCGVRLSVGNSFACAQNQGLAINCSREATNEEVQQLAIALSRPPLKAIFISLNDGPQVVFENLAPVREQAVVFQLQNCRSTRLTKKLAQLRLPHLLEFSVHHCRALDVRRADFWQSAKLRLIQFVNSTIEFLEEGTFADLPGLRLLSLERGLTEINFWEDDVSDFVMKLHCGCEFDHFRRWWRTNGLLKYATEGQVYRIEYDAWRNEELIKSDIFLQIDCVAISSNNGTFVIDDRNDFFSTNEELYTEQLPENCASKTHTTDEFPTFSSEPMTERECRVRQIVQCSFLQRDYGWCEHQWPGGHVYLNTNCSYAVEVREIRQLAQAMALQPPRPTVWTIIGALPVTAADVAPIRRTIVSFDFFKCTSSRSTTKAGDLQLSSLLDYGIWDCSDLEVQRADFQRLSKLRLLMFSNTTIRSLQFDAFGYLPALRLLSLEHEIYDNALEQSRGFGQRIRDYLWRLHCGCDFAWFRQWWTNNTLLVHAYDNDAGEVYAFRDYARSYPLFRQNIFLPVDCAKPIPRGAHGINHNETAFSRHVSEC
ncbi:uncharacterized protein LOC129593028 isoform X2 [Paramacrobiotus metropolitanus]|uniref:uncharacterized protein LOC129593028 isoform X2 n=1 Tax=Paramacrobiotus metropolitanus TaxID=2943436 RepID=UPI002445990A|nr:uncharacterized protein LOC129593028 isoform X2 [Paramacrobiotus metropolitanus]